MHSRKRSRLRLWKKKRLKFSDGLLAMRPSVLLSKLKVSPCSMRTKMLLDSVRESVNSQIKLKENFILPLKMRGKKRCPSSRSLYTNNPKNRNFDKFVRGDATL